MSENGLSGKRAAHLDSHQECSFHELKLSLFTTSYPSISSAGFFFFSEFSHQNLSFVYIFKYLTSSRARRRDFFLLFLRSR